MALQHRAVVIGYGNTLRGDDAIGPYVAETVDAWNLPGVEAVSAHQLTPELADTLAAAGIAVFVDAAVDVKAVTVSPVQPGESGPAMFHAQSPSALLTLARAAGYRCPPAWLVSAPVEHFEFAAPLSDQGRRSVEDAARAVRRLLAEHAGVEEGARHA